MPSFQGLKSCAMNLLRLTKSTKILLFFFGVISVYLPQTVLDEKCGCIFACLFLSLSLSPSLSVSVSVSCLCLCVEQDFFSFPRCIVSLLGVSNWFFYFRGLELCQSSRVCLKLFIDLSFLLPLLSLWVFYNCQIFCI